MPFAAQVTNYMMNGDMNDWQGKIKLSSIFYHQTQICYQEMCTYTYWFNNM